MDNWTEKYFSLDREKEKYSHRLNCEKTQYQFCFDCVDGLAATIRYRISAENIQMKGIDPWRVRELSQTYLFSQNRKGTLSSNTIRWSRIWDPTDTQAAATIPQHGTTIQYSFIQNCWAVLC
jgi:hypothetical protein